MDTVIQSIIDYANTPLDNGTILAYILGYSIFRGFRD